MTRALTILIIGGYGIFGGRLVDLLKGEAGLTLIVAGRSLEKATAFCKARPDSVASLIPAAVDRSIGFSSKLDELKPDIVVDASGPFQAYGDNRYDVIAACIASRVNYLDLADGAAFVAGVSRYDDAAKAAGIYVLSGVSTFPVLTAAVVRRLSVGMAHLKTIHGGIAPSPYAGVGENVIRAIASYSGQRIELRRDGRTGIGFPLTEQMRYTIAPPGHVPLRNIMFSLVDVPDLCALPILWPSLDTVWMGAGPVPEMLHRALVYLSWLVRIRIVPTLQPLTPLIHFVMNHLRWGEHRGGMFVAVTGREDAGGAVERSWHLLAEGDDGPYIPSMAVQALVRRALAGNDPPCGARACLTDLELEDYEALFQSRNIHTGIRQPIAQTAPLYQQILLSVWDELPSQIRAMHDGVTLAKGEAVVERGQGFLARFVAAIIGFPKATPGTPVTVCFHSENGVETWTRRFGADEFFSNQLTGKGRSTDLLCEQFGPLTFAMAMAWKENRLSLILRRWSVFGIPMPMALCPRTTSYETVIDGRFNFHVDIGHRITGLIVRYRGWLVPEDEAS